MAADPLEDFSPEAKRSWFYDEHQCGPTESCYGEAIEQQTLESIYIIKPQTPDTIYRVATHRQTDDENRKLSNDSVIETGESSLSAKNLTNS